MSYLHYNYNNSRHTGKIKHYKKCCIVKDVNLTKFSNIEIQFLKWIQLWESRVFLGNTRILQVRAKKCFYSGDVDRIYQMDTYIKSYQESNSNIIGQDRFVWTAFANALIKKYKIHHIHLEQSCPRKLCLFLLVWSSYFLNLPNLNQVQEVLREVIVCTQSLRFIFSFLPGSSMTSYIAHFVSEKNDENILCDEFFIAIEEDSASPQCNISLYECYAPLILYIVKNLTPFQFNGCGHYGSHTLISLLDKSIGNGIKSGSMLTIAVQHKDAALVKLLLQMGASANIDRWDPITEDSINVEHIVISSINSLVASKHFFTNIKGELHPPISYIMHQIDSVSLYGNMLRRSLLDPSSRKADNMWRAESWRQELNSEIADKWGVGYERPFPSLKLIAKIKIRQHISQMDKKVLYKAILELPLPNMLKSYLNLMLD